MEELEWEEEIPLADAVVVVVSGVSLSKNIFKNIK